MKKLNIAIVLVLACFLVLLSGCKTEPVDVDLDAFAQYLTGEGISMAGTDWCGHCKDQKELFGSSFQYIDYHNCDEEPGWCSERGVPGYPTWVLSDGSIYPGVKSIDDLKELSGYDG
jgi:hypothetical protein